MGESEHSTVEPDQSVHEAILELLDADNELDETARDLVLSALADVTDQADGDVDTDWSPTYLTNITVTGFRGIGPTAKLDLHPAPGLTVVSGRNGSGKSSFAEAVELALTGSSFRWRGKQSMWSESWRNLHKPHPSSLRVAFTREGSGPVTVGVGWAQDAELADRTLWTQYGDGDRVDGIDGLGWAEPLELYQPVLTYEELGRLFDGGPSALYDALAKLLGLEVLSAVEKKLAADLKEAKQVRDAADGARKRAMAALSSSEDERATGLLKLMKKHVRPLDEILAVVTGANQAEQSVVPALRALADMEIPEGADITSAVTRLQDASEAMRDRELVVVALASQRVDLLTRALDYHSHAGNVDCPVCGEGRLDPAWADTARSAVTQGEATLADYRSATQELKVVEERIAGLAATFQPVQAIGGVDLHARLNFNAAAETVQSTPVDGHHAVELQSALADAAEAAELLKAEADEVLRRREDAWAPLAAQVAAWIPEEEQSQNVAERFRSANAAKSWATAQGTAFRNLRLKPIAEQARHIWSELRQESNVDLSDITLAGTATRRKAVLRGAVDGEETQALSVMSQGEQNAVALALFLPRATAVRSPFRFVVLDDPIQAMDPSKIDGFVRVLTRLARTHQIVVFSHDDRLASVIRETGIDAQLLEVVRESGSRVRTRLNVNPAKRLIADAFALVQDEKLDGRVKGRVAPSLFRMALEAAARQAHYAKQSSAGTARLAAEKLWQDAKSTRQRLALAVLGDAKADVGAWLHARKYRKEALDIGNAGAHGDAGTVTRDDVRDLERAVGDLLGSR